MVAKNSANNTTEGSVVFNDHGDALFASNAFSESNLPDHHDANDDVNISPGNITHANSDAATSSTDNNSMDDNSDNTIRVIKDSSTLCG